MIVHGECLGPLLYGLQASFLIHASRIGGWGKLTISSSSSFASSTLLEGTGLDEFGLSITTAVCGDDYGG